MKVKYVISNHFHFNEDDLQSDFLADMRIHAGQEVDIKETEYDGIEIYLDNGLRFSHSGKRKWYHDNERYPVVIKIKVPENIFNEELFTI